MGIVYSQEMHVSPSIIAMRRNLMWALRHRDFTQAGEILQRLKEEDPLSIQTRGAEFEMLILNNRLEEASRLAPFLDRDFPASPRIHYLAGRLYYGRKEYERALKEFEESWKINAHWKTRQWIGKTMTQIGNFDEAESLLSSLVSDHPGVQLDLAWMYERRGELHSAMECLLSYRRLFPDDAYSLAFLERLRARMMNPLSLIEEVRKLQELEEEIPERVLVEYIESLLKVGEIPEVRRLLGELRTRFTDAALTGIAWACHRAAAPDLAFELFLHTFERNRRSPKFLAALEADGRRLNRLPELIEVFLQHAPDQRPLYGRARKLGKHIQPGQD